MHISLIHPCGVLSLRSWGEVSELDFLLLLYISLHSLSWLVFLSLLYFLLSYRSFLLHIFAFSFVFFMRRINNHPRNSCCTFLFLDFPRLHYSQSSSVSSLLSFLYVLLLACHRSAILPGLSFLLPRSRAASYPTCLR